MTLEKEENKTEADIPVIISEELKYKLDYLSSFSYEIAGWLTGKYNKDGIFLNDILIPKQEVTGASVDINTNGCVELVKEFKEKCKDIIGYMHSHAGMSTFWSTVDDENIKNIMEPRKFFVFIVSSRGEHLVRLEVREPFKISVDNIGYIVHSKENEKLKNEIDKEIEKKVVKKVTSVVNIYRNNEFQKPLDFEKVIAPGLTADYVGRTLNISGLLPLQSAELSDVFKAFRPVSGKDNFGNISLIFPRIKRKKARKIIDFCAEMVGVPFEDIDYDGTIDYDGITDGIDKNYIYDI